MSLEPLKRFQIGLEYIFSHNFRKYFHGFREIHQKKTEMIPKNVFQHQIEDFQGLLTTAMSREMSS
jgi:hypothetical protein